MLCNFRELFPDFWRNFSLDFVSFLPLNQVTGPSITLTTDWANAPNGLLASGIFCLENKLGLLNLRC